MSDQTMDFGFSRVLPFPTTSDLGIEDGIDRYKRIESLAHRESTLRREIEDLRNQDERIRRKIKEGAGGGLYRRSDEEDLEGRRNKIWEEIQAKLEEADELKERRVELSRKFQASFVPVEVRRGGIRLPTPEQVQE